MFKGLKTFYQFLVIGKRHALSAKVTIYQSSLAITVLRLLFQLTTNNQVDGIAAIVASVVRHNEHHGVIVVFRQDFQPVY